MLHDLLIRHRKLHPPGDVRSMRNRSMYRIFRLGRPIATRQQQLERRQQQLPRRQQLQQLERVFVLQASRHRRQHHVLRRLHHPHVHLKRHVPGHEREPGLRGCAGRWRRRRSYCAVGWWRWRGSAEIRRQSCDQAVIHRDCRCRWTTYDRASLSRWRTRRKQFV